jgi:CheY-like chemotaxis protein
MAAKVLLVEDDNNLREIYQARLQAEGYDIVAAKDGEEALVIAKREQPDLIISDVMMPRVSGFEMLDILRNTQGLKAPRVIMLTALGQADDKIRADQLGADRYLVKSQVTLEDIVKSAQELLTGDAGDDAAPTTSDTSAGDDTADAADEPEVVDTPLATEPDAPTVVDPVDTPAEPATEPAPAAPITGDAVPAPTTPGAQAVVTSAVEADPSEKDPNDQLIADALKDLTNPDTAATTDVDAPADAPANDDEDESESDPVDTPAEPATEPAPAPAPVQAPANDDEDDSSNSLAHKKVIQPLNAIVTDDKPDLNDLLAKEEAKTADSLAATTAPAPRVPAQDVHSSVPPHPPGHVITPPAASEAAEKAEEEMESAAVVTPASAPAPEPVAAEAPAEPEPAPVEPPAAPAPQPEPATPPKPALAPAPEQTAAPALPTPPPASGGLDPSQVAL